MNRREFAKLSALSLAATALPARAQTVSGTMIPVLKRGFDNSNSGCNLLETTLTQANVAAQGIKLIGRMGMQGDLRGCEAQPLIVPSVACGDGLTRDLVILCSMNNTVWAFDPNSFDPTTQTFDLIWEVKIATPVRGSSAIDSYNINEFWGILSTPVIDMDTKRIYLVAWSSVDGSQAKAAHFVYVLNLGDGSWVCNPVPLSALKSNGETYSSMLRKQRGSLLMTNVGGVKTVFIPASTVNEFSAGATGWVIAFDVATNTVTAALATSAGQGAGIWNSGASMIADAAGYIYASTGNGGFDGIQNFGESIIKLQYTHSPASLAIVDRWSPFTDKGRVETPEQEDEGWYDADVGSSGLLLVPQYNSIVAAGKDSIGFVSNTRNLGETTLASFINAPANYGKLRSAPLWLGYYPGNGVNAAPQDSSNLDFQYQGNAHEMHSTPVSYQRADGTVIVFVWASNSQLRAWSLSSAGQLTFLAQGNETASANQPGDPGGFMCISSNGSKTGTPLLFACIPLGDAGSGIGGGRFLVYNAEAFANGVIKLLWDSAAWGINYSHNKYCPPVVSNGKVLVGTYDDQVLVFALA
ncbi:MAG TPA: hypothetical protein VMQ60_03170 [Acidobacteriaceae bacterium]|jgi:hypothetical protein|nr:hypothetical protein [Acidobacteriaceae bacterium]